MFDTALTTNDLIFLAKSTVGFSGADITEICQRYAHFLFF